MTRILVFGDSIAWGAWDIERGWVERLRKYYNEKNLSGSNFWCLIYNLGISGNGVSDVLERFEFETKQRLKEDEETIIIFAVGINDSVFVHSKGATRSSGEEVREKVKELVEKARKYSSKIVFVGLTPVDESLVNPIPWIPNESLQNKYVKEHNNVIKEVCEEEGIGFVNVFEKFLSLDYEKLLEDGLHPNSEGHEKIFEMVKDYLERQKII